MKVFMYIVLIALFILVTFFGLGPVLFSDGSPQERMITLGVVLLIYVVITWIFIRWRGKR